MARLLVSPQRSPFPRRYFRRSLSADVICGASPRGISMGNDPSNRLLPRRTTDIQPRLNGETAFLAIMLQIDRDQIVGYRDGYPSRPAVAWRRGGKVLDKLAYQTHPFCYPLYPCLVVNLMRKAVSALRHRSSSRERVSERDNAIK